MARMDILYMLYDPWKMNARRRFGRYDARQAFPVAGIQKEQQRIERGSRPWKP